MSDMDCPLCYQRDITYFFKDKRRQYLHCNCCELVFADPLTLLSAEEELAQYQLHQNDLNDDGYRRFLSRLASPLLTALPATAVKGLDFGCGPGPLLALMLTEAGHQMAVWDPFFANDPAVLQQQYDFISCSEAIEHFVRPAEEWALWLTMLAPGGILAIMTKRYTSLEAFAQWHYKNDPTHVSFFSKQTFIFLAQRDGFRISFPADDVVLLQRNH